MNPIVKTCARCKRVREKWEGTGYQMDRQLYCCRGCAFHLSCGCQKIQNDVKAAKQKLRQGASERQKRTLAAKTH